MLKLFIALLIWIIFIIITYIKFIPKINKENNDGYIVCSSKFTIFLFAIMNIVCYIFIMWLIFNYDIKQLWLILFFILFFILSFIGYWDRLQFKIKVFNNNFIIRNLFTQEIKYSFKILTDYRESYFHNDNLLFCIKFVEAFKENKSIIRAYEWDIGYDKLSKDIRKNVKKNINTQNTKKTIILSTYLSTPVFFTIMGIIGLYIFYKLILEYTKYHYIYGYEKFYFKGGEIIPIILIFSISIILYGIKHLTTKISIDNKIIYKRFFFIENIYYFNNIKKATKGSYFIKIYDTNNKKIFTIPDFYKNQEIFLTILKKYKIPIKN